MKIDEEAKALDISEEVSDPLGAQDSAEEEQEDSDGHFRSENLPAEQRAQVEKAVQAVNEFIEKHPTYKQTEANQKAVLDYLADHDLQISPAALELAWEQLQDSLDVEPEEKAPEESVANRVRESSADALARKTEQEPPEEPEEEPAEEEPVAKRGKVIGFRNGRRVGVGA